VLNGTLRHGSEGGGVGGGGGLFGDVEERISLVVGSPAQRKVVTALDELEAVRRALLNLT
jgi:hypothetical protein